MGVRDRSAAGPRDQADPRQLGRGRLGTGPGGTRPELGAAGGVHEAGQIMTDGTLPTPVSGAGGAEVYAKLAELGLTLPEVVPPLAAYVPAVQSGNYVYVSGQLPLVQG